MIVTHTGIFHRILFPSLVWKMPSKKIFLTFDDGPHPQATAAILDMLRQHSVRATFFVSGKNIRGNEPLIQRIASEGHSIGIHAFHHSRALALSKERTKSEILETQNLLSSLVRQKIRLFRPPFGFFSWKTIEAARELNYVLIMWSCLTGDFRPWSEEKIVSTATHRLTHGSILVFHDNDLTAAKIAGVLDTTIRRIKNLGFEFGAIR